MPDHFTKLKAYLTLQISVPYQFTQRAIYLYRVHMHSQVSKICMVTYFLNMVRIIKRISANKTITVDYIPS